MDKKKTNQSITENLKTETQNLKDALKANEKKDWKVEDKCLEEKTDNYCGKTDHL